MSHKSKGLQLVKNKEVKRTNNSCVAIPPWCHMEHLSMTQGTNTCLFQCLKELEHLSVCQHLLLELRYGLRGVCSASSLNYAEHAFTLIIDIGLDSII